MPNVIVTRNTYPDAIALENVIHYVLDKAVVVGGYAVDCGNYAALEQMLFVKQAFRKSEALQLKHFFITFADNEMDLTDFDELLRLGFAVGQLFYNYKAESEGLSAKTIVNLNLLLHSALKFAVAEGYINSNPASSVNLPSGGRPQITILTRDEQDELDLIHKKMAQYGTTNLSAFLRKMSIDGYVVKLELPELKEMVSLLRYSSNNLNQLTKRVHETGRIYDADLEDIKQGQERIWDMADTIITKLAKLK